MSRDERVDERRRVPDRRRWFGVAAAFLVAAVIGALAFGACWILRPDPNRSAFPVSRAAWRATYTERGLAIPPDGPRDGIGSQRLPARPPDPKLGWREVEIDLPGRLEVDERGFQHYRSARPSPQRIAILGGSVGYGIYASSLDATYFQQLGRALDRDPATAADIVVFASLAWKSGQEAAALDAEGEALAPDLVVVIDGLNDLTNGSNAHTFYGVETETLDGSDWNLLYHEHDYRERVEQYLYNVAQLYGLARAHDAELLMVLQPSLFERATPSAVEADLLRRALLVHASRDALRESYATMRSALGALGRQPGRHWLDASRLFAGERATTFTDVWHFSDRGHRLLAEALAEAVAPILRKRTQGAPPGAGS